jgi:hypothetical protein
MKLTYVSSNFLFQAEDGSGIAVDFVPFTDPKNYNIKHKFTIYKNGQIQTSGKTARNANKSQAADLIKSQLNPTKTT